MSRYRVGELIEHYRMQQGITIEELAGTQMSTVTYWRTVKGESMPSKINLEYLFQKLGLDPNSITVVYMDGRLVEAQELTDAIDTALMRRDAATAEKYIHKLEGIPQFAGNKFNMQYLLAAKAALGNIKGSPAPELIDMLKEAFVMTRKKFEENRISEYFLTKVDFSILSMMARHYFEQGERERAVDIYYSLKKNIGTQYFDDSERGRRYPGVIYNLTKFLGILERHEEVIPLCDEGKKVCIDTGFLRLLPNIMTNKALSMLALGDESGCIDILKDVCHTFSLFGRHEEIKIIKDYAAEKKMGL